MSSSQNLNDQPAAANNQSVVLKYSGLVIPARPEFKKNRLPEDSPLESTLVSTARICAHTEFKGHFRKFPKGLTTTALPYVVHLEEVAQILASYKFDAKTIAAGYLHDHLEDLSKQGWNMLKLSKEFGSEVAELVSWVSQQDKSLPWKERQIQYFERLKEAPTTAVAISLADKLSNTEALIFWMQRGYAVEQVIAKGWKENSEKLHSLNQLYKERLPVNLTRFFERTLRQFDRLGQNFERRKEASDRQLN